MTRLTLRESIEQEPGQQRTAAFRHAVLLAMMFGVLLLTGFLNR